MTDTNSPIEISPEITFIPPKIIISPGPIESMVLGNNLVLLVDKLILTVNSLILFDRE